MNFIFDFLLSFLKTLLQVFAKSCVKKKKNDTNVKKPRKRTTSISKTEKIVVETVSESYSESKDDEKKKT